MSERIATEPTRPHRPPIVPGDDSLFAYTSVFMGRLRSHVVMLRGWESAIRWPSRPRGWATLAIVASFLRAPWGQPAPQMVTDRRERAA